MTLSGSTERGGAVLQRAVPNAQVGGTGWHKNPHRKGVQRTVSLHVELIGKLIAFAGTKCRSSIPGILKEHLREAAGLFDVSHMSPVELAGDDPLSAIETMVPGDICGLDDGTTRYTQLTDDDGGILDDLMVTRDGARPTGGQCSRKDKISRISAPVACRT